MSTTIAISPEELKSLIHDAVNEAFENRLASRETEWDDEITDAALARAMDEAKGSPRLSPEEFLKRLESDT